jgi:peptidoglycan hydrolase CwlO-like protein
MKASSTPQGASDDNDVNGIVAANELLCHVLARHDAQIQAQHNNVGQGIHEQVARLSHQVDDTQTSIESLETTVNAQADNIREILRILHGRGSEN